jgi:hypothetical protein
VKLSILSILLWPKNLNKALRHIDFEEGKVNVLTGTSRTGKSSLLHIVDYCLGSGKCSIPVGKIREKTAWFGVLLQLESRQVLVARSNPEEKEQTGDMFWLEGESVAIDTIRPEKKCNIGYVKARFNELAGLPDLGFDPDSTSSNFKTAASFRDMAAFNFQPQHIVANPHAIFFKTDSFEHREKLRTVFPLALGAITTEQLVAKHQLSLVENELLRRVAALDHIVASTNQWLGEIQGAYSRARELGLLPNAPAPREEWPTERYLEYLRKVPENLREMRYPSIDVQVAETTLNEILHLEDEENRLSREIADKRRNMYRIQRLASSFSTYASELSSQEARLYGVGWFKEAIGDRSECPFCGSSNESAQQEVAKLVRMGEELDRLTSHAVQSTPILDREQDRLNRRIVELERGLEMVRNRRWQLEDESQQLAERRHTLNAIYRFVGRLEQALDGYWKAAGDSELKARISELQAEAARLRRAADPSRERERLEAKQLKFTQTIVPYVTTLRLERSGDPVQLNIKELTIDITSAAGRRDALWEIGSAENWMGYHIGTMLALHEMFLDERACPVPSFLMIDQPSQVYFPDRWPGDMKADEESESSSAESEDADGSDQGTRGRDAVLSVEGELERRSEDIAGVRRIFETLSKAVERTKHQLQLIVTEHAGEITWRGIEHIHVVGNWRPGEDDYLIPDAWLEE